MTSRPAWLCGVLVAVALAGCGKTGQPKVDAATERAEALERARHDAFGAQVKGLDAARALEADINRKATESVDNIEKNAK